MKKRILSVVLALCIAMSAAFAVGVYADDANGVLRFNENGEFTIMHLTDTQDGYPTSEKTLSYSAVTIASARKSKAKKIRILR